MEDKNNHLKNIVTNIEGIMKHYIKVIKCLIVLIISYIRYNKDIYQNLQPDIDGSDTNVCLICSVTINNISYAKFCECDHKICSDCVNQMTITSGSCPFHSNGIKNFIKIYFIINYRF